MSKQWLLITVMAAAPVNLYSQFEIENRKIEVHGFVSQGFTVSNGNNYLTMKTTAGSFAFTDGAINVSSQLTSKFRVGAQMYVMNIGKLRRLAPAAGLGIRRLPIQRLAWNSRRQGQNNTWAVHRHSG
ncbi:MAG TPA: hypothetical protein VK638_20190 [Edaphobacter sp.]|nr:hypothetical protein [Edaphobacter sp.]